MSYYRFLDDLGEPYGQFEVFYRTETAIKAQHTWRDDHGAPMEAGWYWWACFPGCLPDSDPVGPFATEAEAIADAQEQS
jgi:hypothetical protein